MVSRRQFVKTRFKHLIEQVFVVVHSAEVQDRAGVVPLVTKAQPLTSCAKPGKIGADGAYTGKTLQTLATKFGWTLEIVKRKYENCI